MKVLFHMKTSEKPIWTVGQVRRTYSAALALEKNCHLFDLLPNNHANRSEAKTRRRVKCTGAVGRGKKITRAGPRARRAKEDKGSGRTRREA